MKVYLEMSGKLRSLTAYTTLTLVVLSAISSFLIALPLVEVVRAQTPSITVSSEYFNRYKAIFVEVRGDLGTYIRVRITDDITGDTLAEEDIPRVGVGYYPFFLLGPDATVKDPRGYPLIPVDPVTKGTPVRIEVVGTALTYVVRYDVVKPTVTLDKKEYPYRRDATVVISYTDEDADRDPTDRDILYPEHVAVAITLVKADGTVRYTSTDLEALGAQESKEPAVRGGRFTFAVTISKISDALGVAIGKDDRVLLSFRTRADAQGWLDDPTTVDFRAVYRYPTVSITFNQQVLVIDVTSPDDNVDSRVPDTLDPDAIVRLVVGTAPPYDIPAKDFRETGANTNVFRMTFSVTWGTAYVIDYAGKRVILPRDTLGPFEATARYYKDDPREGYSIDASGRGTYAPVLPTIRVDKASLKSIIVTITKPDLNNDPRSIEMLRGTTLLTTGKFDVRLEKDGIYLARIRILDKDGRLVDFTGAPAGITMVETDFNSGVFVLKIRGDQLGIVAGETYTLEYRDFAGFRGDAEAAHRVRATFKVEEIKLTIDRAEYPAVPGTEVIVHVDYANDLHNPDATKKDSVTVSYRIVAFDGTTILASGNIDLEETDVDTGLFRGKATVAIPSDPRVIGGKLVVFDPGRPEAKAEAVLKVYNGELTASPATIRMGGVITITVRDLDYNRDSSVAEERPALVSVRSGRCLAFPVTLRETGANTGVFTATVRWDRTTLGCAAAPDTITVEYVDTRARELITGYEPYTVTLRATVTLTSTTGVLRTVTAEAGRVSIIETFRIVVEDWDLNTRFNARDPATVYVLVEGVHTIAPEAISLEETGSNTGVFEMSLRLTDIRGVPMDIKDLAKLIGKRVILMYIDEADATGARTVVQTILTITAYDPELSLSPEAAVSLGEVLTITVVDKNRVGAGTASVMVRSTIYPVPITYHAREEVVDDKPTGVFTARIRVVDVKDWYPGYPEPSVPARFGDTVEVIYMAPVNSKGETDVIYTKSITAGIRPAIPAETKKVEFLDERGAAVTPRVGVLTFITVTVANADIVTHSMAIMVVVRDPTGVAVALYFASVTLPPGASQHVGFGWTPMISGKHTIEVYVVKSLADRTPMASPTSATVDVAK